jgi:hypothetical protein
MCDHFTRATLAQISLAGQAEEQSVEFALRSDIDALASELAEAKNAAEESQIN